MLERARYNSGMRMSLLALLVVVSTPSARADDPPVLSTSITGSVGATGLDDPQYVLSFVPVQRLVLAAAHHPVSRAEVDAALRGTPVTLEHLLRLDLLARDKAGFRLAYLVLTADDQRAIYDACAKWGASLADAFRARQSDFARVVARYPDASLRPQLAFALVAGAALNWEGLRMTSALGYRVKPPRHANGHTYLVFSVERGAKRDFTGLYIDSETAPGTKLTFSTFGDGVEPRLQALPDAFEGIETAADRWKSLPDTYGALQGEYVALILEAVDDAGLVMSAVANGNDTDAALAKSVVVPEARRKAILRLLVSIGYLRDAQGRYAIAVPLLTVRDKPIVDDVLALAREIMKRWLAQTYPHMARELATLSPMKNGLPFALVFSEVWHYTFGFATKSLAESGFYADPHAAGALRVGYVPLVFAPSLLAGPP